MTGLAKPPEPLTCQKCGCSEIRTIHHAQGCSDPKCSCTNCGYGGNAKEHREHLLIADTLNELLLERGWRFPSPVIVHGNAQGADRLAADEAGKAGMLVESHPADWDGFGKRAGLVRNARMAALGADLCVAFWDGRSTGTLHMLDEARKAGIPTIVVYPSLPDGGTLAATAADAASRNPGRVRP